MLSSELGGGEADTSCFPHFCRCFEQGEVFFLGHKEKQTGPQVNKQMNFITIKVRNSVRGYTTELTNARQHPGVPTGPANIYIYRYTCKYMEKSRRGIVDEKCPGRKALQHLFMPSKPNLWDKLVYTHKKFFVVLEMKIGHGSQTTQELFVWVGFFEHIVDIFILEEGLEKT